MTTDGSLTRDASNDDSGADIAMDTSPDASQVALEQALYLTMRDGVRIAVELRLPESREPVPTLVRATRYFRQLEARIPVPDLDLLQSEAAAAHASGYALVVIDARGSGASFGTRPHPLASDEIADYREVIDWVVEQPWSNGRIFAHGISYDGIVADRIATMDHPAVVAVSPQFSDVDPFLDIVAPGGAPNDRYFERWSATNEALDRNDFCTGFQISEADCAQVRMVSSGVKPVDEDTDGTIRDAAVEAHASNTPVFSFLRTLVSRDDDFGGTHIDTISPSSHFAALEQQQTPVFALASWLDAGTALGALRRFMSADSPQVLWLGPWAHGGAPVDPLAEGEPEGASREAQVEAMFAYFGSVDDGEAPAREVRYYTLGEGVWRTTREWPPAGVESRTFYLGSDGELVDSAPTPTTRSYEVDFGAETGPRNRWMQNVGDVGWENRAQTDARLLTYDTPAMAEDTRITGSGTLTVEVTTSREDGLLIAYLEDVGPDGDVTMITEGTLRFLHRAESAAPWRTPIEAFHTAASADAQETIPGRRYTLRISLLPTSVLIRRGHRIRLAMGGQDASTFRRVPDEGDVTLQFHVGASRLDLPVLRLDE